ncbi:hypothetical protein Bca101_018947 [Brassica carinata]
MTTPQEPHFLKPLLPGFHSGVTIPLEFFSKHIQGSEKNKPWKLRSDASDQVWEVIREGRTLTKGWKEFATAHDLRIDDIVIFKHEGDLVFHVTPFGPSSYSPPFPSFQFGMAGAIYIKGVAVIKYKRGSGGDSSIKSPVDVLPQLRSLLRFLEARNVRRGDELISVDMPLIDSKATLTIYDPDTLIIH